MLDGHNRVAKEHFLLSALHDLQEVIGKTFTKARRLALFTDWLADTIGTTTDFNHDSRQDSSTFGAKFIIGRAVIGVAIFAEGLADIFFLVRDIIFKFRLLAFGQDAFDFIFNRVEYSHFKTSFLVALIHFNCRKGFMSSYIARRLPRRTKSPAFNQNPQHD